MIETSLLVKIACDNCEEQVDEEMALDGATRPDIALMEGRLMRELIVEYCWERQEKNGETFILCPACVVEEK